MVFGKGLWHWWYFSECTSGNLTILGTRMGVWYLMLLNTKWVLFGNKRVRYMIHLCWYLTEPKAVPFDYTFIKWPVLDDT